jgi:hypothetical protein
MEKGTCKLCLLDADLCDSHYVPRATYKYSRAKQLKTPHPVVVSGDTARQGTDQARDYVFCKECENRFRVNRETWVLANIPHDYGEPFPLHAALRTATPSIVESGRALIPGRTSHGFDTDKLIYFGASIFWRGAAHQWKLDGSDLPRVDLGCSYQEALRLFLLGKAPFPADVFLTVMLWRYQNVPPAASAFVNCDDVIQELTAATPYPTLRDSILLRTLERGADSIHAHLKRLLSEYIRYYHEDRTHLGLGKGTPSGRTRTIASGHVVSHVRLGGLHHRYDRAA